jgi:hypothetical protein
VGAIYPEEIKLTHWIPSIFVMGVASLLVLAFLYVPLFFAGLAGLVFYFLAIFIHSLLSNKNLKVAIYSVPSAWLQLWGYGLGFLKQRMQQKQRR